MKRLTLLICLIAGLAFAPQVRAAVLYGATASGGPGELYVLNAATGAVIKDVGPLNDATGLNFPLTGLAVHPLTGVLYGSAHNNSNADPNTVARLVTVDPATALVTVIGEYNAGNPGRPATMTDLAFDAAGNLYGIGSTGGPQLYSINIATGQATLVGSSALTSTTGGGIAIDANGTFYGTPTASRFGTYDGTTGAFTEIINPIVRPGGGGAYAALEFSPTGELYGLNSAPGSPPPTYLAIIDPTTGSVTNVGQTPFSLDAIAFAVIPEPTTLALVFSGALVGITRRR